MRRLVAIYAPLGVASHRTATTALLRPDISPTGVLPSKERSRAVLHLSPSGPLVDSERTLAARFRSSTGFAGPREIAPHNSLWRTLLRAPASRAKSQRHTDFRATAARARREKREAAKGLVVASAARGGALHPSDQPQVARARRRHLRKHAPTKMQ